jgi:hypothetical protein
MADLTSEYEDLDTLLASPGWTRVRASFDQEWGRTGARYCDLLEKMVNTADPVDATRQLQQVIWVRKELEAFFAAIASRHQYLKAQTERPDAQQSRRGVL